MFNREGARAGMRGEGAEEGVRNASSASSGSAGGFTPGVHSRSVHSSRKVRP